MKKLTMIVLSFLGICALAMFLHLPANGATPDS